MRGMRQVQPRSLVSLELKSTSYTHDIRSYNGTSIQGTPSGPRQVSLEWGSLYNIRLPLHCSWSDNLRHLGLQKDPEY